MPIPVSLTPITVTGRYERPDGTPAKGTVEFRLSAPATVPADKVMVPQVPTKVGLDPTGAFSVALPASNDADWSVSGLTYQVTERITAASDRTYSVSIPANAVGGTVDLATLAPAVAGPPLVSYVLAATVGAVGGPAGPLDATGKLPASQVPASASPVQSVAGKAGEVVLVAADVAGVETPDGAQDKADAALAAAIEVSAQRASNLADLSSAATARANLGLGGASTLNVGTATGTVAAGDDARITGAMTAVPVAGAGGGVADDRAAIVAADTAASTTAAVLFRAGTYRVASNLTLAAPVIMLPGAVIKPDSGVTVILAGGCDAPRRQVFDHSAGGVVAPRRVDHYHPAWWGATGGADDTAAWTAMSAALTASFVRDTTTGIDFGQRILAPAGVNRFFGVTLSNCHLIAEKGVSIFYPSGAPASGSMLTVGDYCTITGGYWRTNGTGQAVRLIDYQGYRARVENVYLVPAATGSVGIYVGAGPTITPVLGDIQINPLNRLGKGIVLNSADCEMSNIWIGNCDIGLEMLRGAGMISNLHIWSCNTGMSSNACDDMRISNLFLDSNLGWGADLDLADRNLITNVIVWNNGAGQAGTGGIRLRRSTAGSARDNILTSGTFDDNTGVGLLVDGPFGTEVSSVRFGSRSVQAGGPAVTDTAVRVLAASTQTALRVRARRADVVTAVVDDQAASTSTTLGEIKRTLTADVPFTANTTLTPVLGFTVEPGERWLLDGVLLVDGPQAADLKARLQGTSIAGVAGTFAVTNAPAGSATAATAASVLPANATAVVQTGGPTLVVGLLGVGTLQALTLSGYVTTGTTSGSLDLQAAQNTSDPAALTIKAGSWLRGVRVG